MVHVIYDVNSYGNFYQSGGSMGPYYEGFRFQRGFGYRRQMGRGMGSLLSRAWRYLIPLAKQHIGPLLKEAGLAIADEGLHAGQRALESIEKGTDVGDALVTESTQAFKNLGKRGAKRIAGVTVGPPRGQQGGAKKKKKPAARSVAQLHSIGRSLLESTAIKNRRKQNLGSF